MKFDISYENNEIYKGAIPYFLENSKCRNTIYISCSNRNIDEYYFMLGKISEKKIMKIENENENNINKLGDIYNFHKSLLGKERKVILMNLETALGNFSENFDKIDLKKNKHIKQSRLIERMLQYNYQYNYLVEKVGEYSKRGDIIDIYPANKENPIRIEFFGDEIESMRYFDIDSQKSIQELDEIEILSINHTEEKKSIVDILEIVESTDIYLENTDMLLYKLEEYIMINKDSEEKYRKRFENIMKKFNEIKIKRFTSEEIEFFRKIENIEKIAKEKNIYIYTENKNIMSKYNIDGVNIEKKDYFEGFYNKNQLILTERELSGIKINVHFNKRKDSLKLKNINQIKIGDYIIHENNGVGIYLGMEIINNKDYLKIKYADEDKLYVPIEYINRIEKYIVEPGYIPEVYKLGTRGFKRKKDKLRKNIVEFAIELVKIQAKRNLKKGFIFSKDSLWQEEFEEKFPYTETKDQKRAINDVKMDMETGKVMDRIVCGDVGYGKTEVALRAAFKAVFDNKQVVLLAPTTVLVNQHFKRFTERFSEFPVNIEMISRLEKGKKQTEIIKGLKEGKIDIIIGTHRILSNDISFKNIGLLIIDEEQKFGVGAKEKIKKYKNEINILTLTATPIPRTLNLALLGIKDISIIETPPKNRLPIETKIIKKEIENIKEIILKEIARDGQVFYVYNSVKMMKNKLKELENMLPKYIKIAYANGQMEAAKIKETIEKFENGDYDVLLTTTIIENGIDIENVNTIIIENFDKLGISQIYQLRGRVGRSGKKSYCYLLYNSDKLITKKGKAKTQVFSNMNELGAGFELSLEDMKIRGAGEILGDKQHGAVETFGYDLYLKMLREEIENIKYNKNLNTVSPIIEIKETGFIPTDYINQSEKFKIYKRMVQMEKYNQIVEIEKELLDRFGEIPKPVNELLEYYKIKTLCIEAKVRFLKEMKENYKIYFFENRVEIDKVNMLLLRGEAKYTSKEKALVIPKKKNIEKILEKII